MPFKKGVSGNPAGRPKGSTGKKKKGTLTGAEQEELAEMIENKDMEKVLKFLVLKAGTVAEAARYIERFGQFVMPKLSSTKSEITEDRNIEIKWKDSGKEMKNITGT